MPFGPLSAIAHGAALEYADTRHSVYDTFPLLTQEERQKVARNDWQARPDEFIPTYFQDVGVPRMLSVWSKMPVRAEEPEAHVSMNVYNANITPSPVEGIVGEVHLFVEWMRREAGDRDFRVFVGTLFSKLWEGTKKMCMRRTWAPVWDNPTDDSDSNLEGSDSAADGSDDSGQSSEDESPVFELA